MTSTDDPAANRRVAPFLNCPRCGLSIRPKARWMTVEHCPRCLARARVAVRMSSWRVDAEPRRIGTLAPPWIPGDSAELGEADANLGS
jgi:hypothetical protein